MKKIYLILSSAFFILGCSNTPTITPDNLPKASVGKPYIVKIEIEKVILVDDLFVDSTITNDSGLVLNTGVGEHPYSDNTIEVKGTPIKNGKYEIILEGQTRNAYGGNINFRKKYDLIVLQ